MLHQTNIEFQNRNTKREKKTTSLDILMLTRLEMGKLQCQPLVIYARVVQD